MKKLYKEDIQIRPAYFWEEVAPVDYTDVDSSIIDWDKARYIMDFARRRSVIAPLLYAISGSDLSTYSNLTPEEKEIGARYMLVPYALRVGNGTVTEEQDFVNGEFLLYETETSRGRCVEAMRVYVWNNFVRNELMTQIASQQLFKDVESKTLTSTEIVPDTKINRFIKTKDDYFKNWIFGISPFQNVFSNKSYWSQALQDGLESVYNGDY